MLPAASNPYRERYHANRAPVANGSSVFCAKCGHELTMSERMEHARFMDGLCVGCRESKPLREHFADWADSTCDACGGPG